MNKQTFPLLLAVFAFFSIAGNAQNFQWSGSMGSVFNDEGKCIAFDPQGNVYSTGYFEGTVDFNPGAGVFQMTALGSTDIFICKLDASGNFIWAKSMGGFSADGGVSLAIDGTGNIYTTGYFQGTADFDPGSAEVNLSSEGGPNAFISKLDSDGNYLWARSIRGAEQGNCLMLDGSGNVVALGYFDGTADFDPGETVVEISSKGSWDIFILKLDPTGNFLWAKAIGGIGSDVGVSMITDITGNNYITGSYSGTVDFNPNEGVFELTSTLNTSDVFVCNLNNQGGLVWAKSFGGAESDRGNTIGIDELGNVYTAGKFRGTADFDPGAGVFELSSPNFSDIFVSKLNAAGNFVWARSIGGSANDDALSVYIDGMGNSFITGNFVGTADFDPGAGTSMATSAGSSDIFVCKLNAEGEFKWTKTIGGSSDDGGGDITMDMQGNLYCTGYFSGTADFDPGSGTQNLTSLGNRDYFLLKLNNIATSNGTIRANSSHIVLVKDPVTRLMSVHSDDVIVQLEIFDLSGQFIYHNSPNVTITKINYNQFKRGVYVLLIILHNGETMAEKILVE